MTGLFRKLQWWRQRCRREEELREELQFHLGEEMQERQAQGMSQEVAARAARRCLGNPTIVREDVRALWSWVLLEQLAQDLRYGLRGMSRAPMFTALAALSLALGIGANTAIYSFMDAILLRSLPVTDPASLVVLKWRSRPFGSRNGTPFVMHSTDGRTYPDPSGVTAVIFPFPAFESLASTAAPVLSSLFAHKQGGSVNLIVNGEAELAVAEYVSGDFFRSLAVLPSAGRLIQIDDDREGAAAVAVLSLGYTQRRFGDAASAIGRSVHINNQPFTVIGVAPAEFSGIDPAVTPQVYVPMHIGISLRPDDPLSLVNPNYYWVEMMGRLKPGVDLAQAQTALATLFGQWVPSTANDRERANLPVLYLEPGAGGLDSLRRQYSQPLYVLLTMVGLILAIACANAANLLLARAAARTREIAVRLSLGAGRWRVVRQLLTESVLLAVVSGALGIVVAVVSMRALTRLLANGQAGFTLHAELNWHVLLVTLALSVSCGMLFGLAPALQATRRSLTPSLRDRAVTEPGTRLWTRFPRVRLTQVLVVAQIATSLLLLVAAGLFVRTLSNLQSIPLGFNRDSVLLFEMNAPQAGYPASRVADFYADVLRRLSEVPGVRGVTLSHASLIRAGRANPITADGQPTRGVRVLWAGPRFFTTMQIPIVRGREITERDRQGTPPAAVVSELFARTYFGDQDPIGRRLEVGARPLEIVGVSGNVRYGGLKGQAPPVVYVAYAQVPAAQMAQVTYALRTEDDPLRYAGAVRQVVGQADAHVPVTNIVTQGEDIDRTINQEIVFARLCSGFAILALTIACVGLYATMAYAVARRTNEIGLRMALGAGRRTITWAVLREVCVLAALGLAVALPVARSASRLIESYLYNMTPNDPRTLTIAAVILLGSALAAGYGPARRASRVDPMVALRHE